MNYEEINTIFQYLVQRNKALLENKYKKFYFHFRKSIPMHCKSFEKLDFPTYINPTEKIDRILQNTMAAPILNQYINLVLCLNNSDKINTINEQLKILEQQEKDNKVDVMLRQAIIEDLKRLETRLDQNEEQLRQLDITDMINDAVLKFIKPEK